METSPLPGAAGQSVGQSPAPSPQQSPTVPAEKAAAKTSTRSRCRRPLQSTSLRTSAADRGQPRVSCSAPGAGSRGPSRTQEARERGSSGVQSPRTRGLRTGGTRRASFRRGALRLASLGSYRGGNAACAPVEAGDASAEAGFRLRVGADRFVW